MSNSNCPAPKHRGAPRHAHLAEAPKRAARNTLVLSSVALAVTGVSVGAGMLGKDAGAQGAADLSGSLVAEGSTLSTTSTTGAAPVVRAPELSRSDARPTADPSKLAAVVDDKPAAITESRTLSQADPHDIAKALLAQFGFSSSQYGCLESLWNRESGWNVHAANPSGAYGIPQSLPGSKMASAGPDWQNDAATQIKWGLGYIQDRYGSPCGAWGHSQATGWY
ncbi:hypothetical protein GCM10028801_13390 [Nocardioides maradonensis]